MNPRGGELTSAFVKLTAVLFIVLSIAGVLCAADVFAADPSADDYYSSFQEGRKRAGENIDWEYSGGVLTLMGSGEMYDFGALGVEGVQPWGWSISGVGKRLPITQVIIKNGITKIGRNAFAGFGDISSAIIADSVETIGQRAFGWCKSVRIRRYTASQEGEANEIGFPKNLKNIEYEAFIGCTSLTSVALPSSVENIGEGAFANCTLLSHMTIPQSVQRINKNAFNNTALYYLAKTGSTLDNCIEVPWGGSLEIPEDIRLEGNNLKEIFFPDGITNIPVILCEHCSSLENIVLPDSVETIGISAFSDCDSLVKIDWSRKTNLKEIGNSVFKGCGSLESVILPEQLKEPEWGNCFGDCTSLKSVHLPDKWENIPRNMFEGCTSLSENGMEWPSRLTTIKSDAFRNTGFKHLDIPDTVTKLETGAFAYCDILSKLHIPSSVQDFEAGVFEGVHSLLTAGPSGTEYDYNVTYDWKDRIPDYAFHEMQITNVDFPEEMTEIGSSAFAYAPRLEVVFLPESIKTIGSSAFQHCEKLRTVRLQKGLENVGWRAFAYSSLTRLLFRGDAPEIDTDAFDDLRITCYYPGGNKTWKNGILDENYSGKVTWKEFGKSTPEFAERERKGTLNKAGRIKTKFFLVDSDGNVMPEVRFSYRRISPAATDGNVIDETFNNEYLVTDIDGGYTFQTPYLSKVGEDEVRFLDFKILSNEDKEIEAGLDFKINTEVTPLKYTEAWTFGIGKNLKIKGAKKALFSVKVAESDGGKIELEHNEDGKENLTLSLTISKSIQDAISRKFDLGGKIFPDDCKLGLDVASSSASASVEKTTTFKHKIVNYDPDNSTHQQLTAAYLMLVMAANNAASEEGVGISGIESDPFMTTAIQRLNANLVKITFDQGGESVKVKLAGSAAILTLDNKVFEPVSNDIKVASLNGSTAYSLSVNNDESDTTQEDPIKTYTAGIKAEHSFSLFSGSAFELVGVKGLYGRMAVNDAKVTYTEPSDDGDDQQVSMSHCTFDSGIEDCIGWDEVLQYHKLTAQGDVADHITGSNKMMGNLSKGNASLMLPSDLNETEKAFISAPGKVTWKDTEQLERTKTLDLGVKINDNFNIGAKYSASREYNTEVENGMYADGKVYLTAESSTNIQNALNEEEFARIIPILDAPRRVLGSWFKDVLHDTSGTTGKTIDAGKALLSTDGENNSWNVDIYKMKYETSDDTTGAGAGSGGKSLSSVDSADGSSLKSAAKGAKSFKIFALAGDAEEDDTATKTVGEPYIIAASKPGEGEERVEVTDISSENPELTLKYTDADLESAGALGKAAQLAIYRKNEDRAGFDYIGGVVDEENRQVTADITKTGEYILAIDNSAPLIGDILCFFGKSTIMTTINSLTGIESGELVIDGNTVLQNNFMNFYDKETGEFKWTNWAWDSSYTQGEHTIKFTVRDGAGHESSKEQQVVCGDAPEIQSISVPDFWYDEVIPVKAIVTSSTDDDSLKVWADIGFDEDSGEGQTCLMTKTENENEWILLYKADSALEEYTFTIRAEDSNGEAYYQTGYSTLSAYAAETIGGVDYQISKRTGLISVYDGGDINVKNLVIPSEVGGVKVRGIAQDTFQYNTNIETVKIPDTVEIIAPNAFRNCYSLKSVDLGTGVKTIGDNAFLNCDSLKTITVPPSVETIGEYALGFSSDAWGDKHLVDGFVINAEEGSAAAEYYDDIKSGSYDPDDPDDPDPSTCDHDFYTYYDVYPTCSRDGILVHECEICGYSYEEDVPSDPDGHFFLDHEIVKYPTPTTSGIVRYTCMYNHDHTMDETVTWTKPIITGRKNLVYKGIIQSPDVEVMNKYGTTLNPWEFDVTAPNSKNVGTYKLTVKTLDVFYGTGTFTYNIIPKGTTLKKLKPAKKKMTVTWNKQATQTTGYEIQYSLKKNMKKAKVKTVSKAKTKLTIKKLKAKKKYYVRIRTFKKVGSRKLYSTWSKIKSVKVK